jgi:hypothetical protein
MPGNPRYIQSKGGYCKKPGLRCKVSSRRSRAAAGDPESCAPPKPPSTRPYTPSCCLLRSPAPPLSPMDAPAASRPCLCPACSVAFPRAPLAGARTSPVGVVASHHGSWREAPRTTDCDGLLAGTSRRTAGGWNDWFLLPWVVRPALLCVHVPSLGMHCLRFRVVCNAQMIPRWHSVGCT